MADVHGSTGAVRDDALIKPLLLGFAALLLLLAFAWLGGEVVKGDTRTFDMVMLRAAQNLRTEQPGFTSPPSARVCGLRPAQP